MVDEHTRCLSVALSLVPWRCRDGIATLDGSAPPAVTYPACLWQIRLVWKPYVACLRHSNRDMPGMAVAIATAIPALWALRCHKQVTEKMQDRYICHKQAVWPAHCRAMAYLLLPRPSFVSFPLPYLPPPCFSDLYSCSRDGCGGAK